MIHRDPTPALSRRYAASLFVVALVAYGLAGNSDFEMEQTVAAEYCENVAAGIWPAYREGEIDCEGAAAGARHESAVRRGSIANDAAPEPRASGARMDHRQQSMRSAAGGDLSPAAFQERGNE